MTWEQILSTIRTAVYGKDVREAIAQGMETVKTFRDDAAESAAEAAAALPLSTTLDESGKAAEAKAVGDICLKRISINETTAQSLYGGLAANIPHNTFAWISSSYFSDLPETMNSGLWIITIGAGAVGAGYRAQLLIDTANAILYTRRYFYTEYGDWVTSPAFDMIDSLSSELESTKDDIMTFSSIGANLLSGVGETSGAYINASGVITTNASSAYTDIIPVEPGKTYELLFITQE